jgi:type I restriction enzyme, S subunit
VIALSLKNGWRTVRFGDVVRNANLTEREPDTAGLDRIVGLEHLDPENLHIRRWNTLENGTSFTRKFVPGQTLFGKRRAYQRKVAFAEFEGICSGDILTFQPNDPEVLLPELLPFICQTDAFFDHALGTSAGSLSPRTSWKALQDFEFSLPHIEDQKRIAEILWAADETFERWQDCADQLQAVADSVIVEMTESVRVQGYPVKRLEEVAVVERGKFSHRPRNLAKFYGGEYPFAQTGDVHSADGYIRNFEYTLTEEGKQYSRSFPEGTILITIAAVIGATAITDRETWATDSVVGIVPGKEMNVSFLEYYLRTRRHFLENVSATQTAQKNINLRVLRPLEVPVPPLDYQEKVVEQLRQIQDQIAHIGDHAAHLREVSREVANAPEPLLV